MHYWVNTWLHSNQGNTARGNCSIGSYHLLVLYILGQRRKQFWELLLTFFRGGGIN